MRRWRTAQKVALLVGLAVALLLLVRLVLAPDPLSADDGWFNYAPNSGLSYSPTGMGGRSPLTITLVGLGATAVWTAVAVWLLGRPGDD